MKETLQETLGQGKKVKVEQKVLIITLYDFNVNAKLKIMREEANLNLFCLCHRLILAFLVGS